MAERSARALAGMHARGLLHLDLHPGNVVLRGDDLAVHLIDLGSVVPLSGAGAVGSAGRGQHRGQPAYRAKRRGRDRVETTWEDDTTGP